MVDITWKKYEKDIKSTNIETQQKALDAFETERDLQMKTSTKAREWETARKKEIEKNKPLWRKAKDDALNTKLDKKMKNLLNAGTFEEELYPAPGYILITIEKQELKTDSGIIVSQQAEEPNEGIVVRCGDTLIWDKTETKCPCKEKEKILFKRGAGLTLLIKDINYKLIYFNDILGVFR